jgi:hypothetical protein
VSERRRFAPAAIAGCLFAATQAWAQGPALPALYWDQPLETAASLRQAGILSLRVPAERADAWRVAGFEATGLAGAERAERIPLPPPGIGATRADWASATRRPWIDANGWRYLRKPGARHFEQAPAGASVLAAVEAFAHGGDLVLAIDPGDLGAFAQALGFLRSLPVVDLPGVADVGVVDDGSPLTGEVMNLLARRNLLFRPVARGAPGLAVVVELGTERYPESEAANPDTFALKVRGELGDERRSLRLYGSESVLARLTGDATRRRLHLVNYGRRSVEGLRVRLLGRFTPGEAHVLLHGRLAVEALAIEGEATEFSLSVLGPYAVVDLTAAR